MEEAIKELLCADIKDQKELMAIKRKLAVKYKIGVIRNSDILNVYYRYVDEGAIYRIPILEKLLRKRAVRTLSGIASVAALTKPYPCPGECAYCPNEKGVPQSYLSNEPAVMRAIRCDFDPYKQVHLRLRSLEAIGHKPTKIELILIGGTWSVFPDRYKYWYIAECFRAANEFVKTRNQPENSRGKKAPSHIKLGASLAVLKKKLIQEQKKNEEAEYKIIGLTVETRPDYINKEELLQLRELGCTRVELGVQAIDDKILERNKRGCGVKEVINATTFLKEYGFKVTYHIMPGLPGSTPAKDFSMFKDLFIKSSFQPDQIKFYPTVVTKGSLLYRWWKDGKYKPYSDNDLRKLVIKCKEVVPEYVRIIRLIRDIPGESIVAGNLVTNLRQIIQEMGVKCKCTRCRETRGQQTLLNLSEKDKEKPELIIINYRASHGEEYFIQFTGDNGNLLYGFCRLRLPIGHKKIHQRTLEYNLPKFLINSAMIRELHVYGELVPIGQDKKIQHSGLGKRLVAEAERIARENRFKNMAIISGVGVRNYYRKLGYTLKGTYMVKEMR